jgi:hypothetical protein
MEKAALNNNFRLELITMKYIFFLPIILLSANAVFSQDVSTNSLSMGQELSSMSKPSGTVSHAITAGAFQSYSSGQVNGSQFFFTDWRPGEVILMNREIYNSGLNFSYDKVRQELFIRQSATAVILLGTKPQIRSFSLTGDDGKQYNFVNSSLFSTESPEFFYQVLVGDSSKLTLLKYTKTTFVKADPTDMMKQKEGDIYDSFVDKYTYYVVKANGVPVPVQLRSKSLKKAFADLQIDPQKYMNDHPESIDEGYLINMIRQLNQ